MTEERKQELRQLLNEAMASLEIRPRSRVESSLLPVDVYRKQLQQRWTSYSVDFNPYIASEATKSKLLDFIRAEFAPFIHEDWIQSASFFIARSGSSMGYPLDMLLEQLLKIAIARGVGGAVSAFDRCTKDTHASFQYIALLEGIRLEAEIQAFEGMRLVPLPRSPSELPRYLPDLSVRLFGMSEYSFVGKTVLIIDGSVSPIFQKPFPDPFREGFQEDDLPFRVEVNGGKFPNFKVTDFYKRFCQALSLACNLAVQIPLEWRFLAEDELFNLTSFGVNGMTRYYDTDLFGSSPEAGEAQIDEAKRLYEILDSDFGEKLRIPIDRWIKSKTDENPVDKMIDLGIAFESLYVSDGSGEITFKLSVRAAWHLGKDKEHRNELLTKFGQIYGCRSNAVHSGKLDETAKFGEERIPISEFIARAQDLCRQSIIKIIEDEQSPDRAYWNSLILSGEAESDLS